MLIIRVEPYCGFLCELFRCDPYSLFAPDCDNKTKIDTVAKKRLQILKCAIKARLSTVRRNLLLPSDLDFWSINRI